jgi:hypothetical protein
MICASSLVAAQVGKIVRCPFCQTGPLGHGLCAVGGWPSTVIELIDAQGSKRVSVLPLVSKCDLFKKSPALTTSPYRAQSAVSLEDF